MRVFMGIIFIIGTFYFLYYYMIFFLKGILYAFERGDDAKDELIDDIDKEVRYEDTI